MKQILTFFSLFAWAFTMAQDNCGVTSDFDYTVIDGEIYFANQTQLINPDINITGYFWEFSDGGFSTDINPIYPLQDFCGLAVCFFVYVDSNMCYVEPLCTSLNLGTPALSVTLNYVYDEVNESIVLSSLASGGSAPYAYSLVVQGMPLAHSTELTIPFDESQFLAIELCATDANGCSSCASLSIINPYLPCSIDLAATIEGNLLTVSPALNVNGVNVDEFEGDLVVNADSSYYVAAFETVQTYLPYLGLHEVCLNLEDWVMEAYPNCPPSVCETFDVVAYSNDCDAYFTYNQTGGYFYFNNGSIGYYDGVVWDFGNGEISIEENPFVILMPGVYVVTLTTTSDITGCTSIYQDTVVVLEPAHICMQVYNDENQNGMQDNGEGPVDSLAVWWGNQQWLVLDGELDVYTNPGSACIQFGGEWEMIVPSQMPDWSGCFMSGTYLLELAAGQELCPIEIGLIIPQANVCGTYFFDANNNAVLDSDEEGIAFSEIHVEYQDQMFDLVTDAFGTYCIDLPIYTGAWFTPWLNGASSPLIQPDFFYFYTTPGPLTVDFGLYQTMDNLDVGIAMSQGGNVTPGFGTIYNLTLQNYSPYGTSCLVNAYNAIGQTTQFVAGGDATASGGTWTINLGAFETVNLWYAVLNSPGMNLGETVVNSVSIVTLGVDPDVNLNNNTFALQSQVVGSYDPNNKLVNPAGVGPTGRISPSVDSFVYTINFQNTGTAPAVNIRVEDEFPAALDGTSIEMLQSSHPATMTIQGQHVEWNFYTIMLADSTTDEPASHGYVTFRIAPTSPLVHGMEISNEAAIYFDFNEPIITAPALVTVDETIGIAQSEMTETLSVYPNPVVDGTIYVSGVSGELQVIDTAGRVVIRKQVTTTQNQLDVSKLKAGIYMIKSKECGTCSSFIKN